MLAVSDFGVPALLRVRVFTTEIFTAFAALYDAARATALAVPLLLLTLGVTMASVRLAGDGFVVTRRGLAGGELQTFERWRPAFAGAVIAVVLCALVLPVGVLTREARDIDSWASVIIGSGEAIRNSLMLAAMGATVVCALAFGLGYARAKTSRAIGVVADVLFIVLFAVPGTIVGVALIGLWNRSGCRRYGLRDERHVSSRLSRQVHAAGGVGRGSQLFDAFPRPTRRLPQSVAQDGVER